MRYQAVIFDLFGTLVDNFSLAEHKHVLSKMAEVVGVPAETFVPLWFGTFNQRCSGTFQTVDENVISVCQSAGVSPGRAAISAAVRIRTELTRRYLVPRRDVVSVLQAIRQRGHRVGLISDCSMEVGTLWPTTPFASVVEAPVFSYAVRLKKPDARIYGLACARLGVEPSQCLYVGDGGSKELTGAAAVGMTAVLLRWADEDAEAIHRVDGEEWAGGTITEIRQVMELL